jgi:SAM-dependent methyltransferase
LVHRSVTTDMGFVDGLYRRARRILRRVWFLRSSHYLMLAIGDAFRDSRESGRTELDAEFDRREDPWRYSELPIQQERVRRELAMIDAVRGAACFGKALEVGCAEGLFTEQLVDRCDSVLALDISPVALARARQRRPWDHRVRFAEWDLRTDPLPDSYDLIVIIHALEYIRNPIAVRRARAKLVDGLRPGGYLLVGTMGGSEVARDSWWGRYILRGGKHLNEFLARHPKVTVVATAEMALGEGEEFRSHELLLRKNP